MTNAQSSLVLAITGGVALGAALFKPDFYAAIAAITIIPLAIWQHFLAGHND